MNRIIRLVSFGLTLLAAAPMASAQAQPSTAVVTETSGGQPVAPGATGNATATTVQATVAGNATTGSGQTHVTAATNGKTTTVAVVSTPGARRGAVTAEANDVLEAFVTWLHHFFPQIDDRLFHWIACLIVILLAITLRHVITNIIFHYLKRIASRTETTLDDKLFPALERPTAVLIMVIGIFAALTVLQLSPEADVLLGRCAQVAVLAVVIWGVIRAGRAVLDQAEEIARRRQMTVATFMPLIKKTLLVFAVILGVLMIAESLGAKVGVLLGSLGIGGLALALAAQDMIANLFGSFVVVMDQPFRVGEFVKIGSNLGMVEDIGLRSTKLRLLDKSLMVIPNKAVAAEAINNLDRFTQRRTEQVIGLTYDTTPDQMDGIVAEFKQIILGEPEVDPASVLVYFRDYSASSLDIWIVYVTKTADFPASMRLRQRINLAMMRAVANRGLSFAFPTRTVQLDGPIARRLVEGRKGEESRGGMRGTGESRG
jgi:MscS family membrane protein